MQHRPGLEIRAPSRAAPNISLCHHSHVHWNADWQCGVCLQEQAYEESQKYKEGKYIIEKAKVMKEGKW